MPDNTNRQKRGTRVQRLEELLRAVQTERERRLRERIAAERSAILRKAQEHGDILFPDRQVKHIIFTEAEAIRDGIKLQIGERLYITTALALRLLGKAALVYTGIRDEHGNLFHFTDSAWERFVQIVRTCVLDYYNAGIYAHSSAADPNIEADDRYAVYEVPAGETNIMVLAIRDGLGLHLLLPEDY